MGSRPFRWISDGILKDIVNGRVVVYMGRRTDANGKLLEGEIVRQHTIDAAKLDQWVKDGRAEYINIVENVVDKLASQPSAEAAHEIAIHQQTADLTDAALRMRALADLRRILDDIDDESRQLAEMEFAEVPTADLRGYLDAAQRGRDQRRSDGSKPKARGKKDKPVEPPAQPDPGGAGPAGGAK